MSPPLLPPLSTSPSPPQLPFQMGRCELKGEGRGVEGRGGEADMKMEPWRSFGRRETKSGRRRTRKRRDGRKMKLIFIFSSSFSLAWAPSGVCIADLLKSLPDASPSLRGWWGWRCGGRTRDGVYAISAFGALCFPSFFLPPTTTKK